MISMSEPAKHCYRAIANFCRFATRKHRGSQSSSSSGHDSRPAVNSAFAMTEMPESTLPPNSLSTESVAMKSVGPPSLAPLTLAEPISVNASAEDISSTHIGLSHTPKSKPSFRKTFSFLTNPQKTHSATNVSSENLPVLGSRTPSEREPSRSRDDSDAEGYVDSPVQESLPEAGLSSDVLDPNFPSDEIKVPTDIPEGSAGNSKIYQVSSFCRASPRILTRRLSSG